MGDYVYSFSSGGATVHRTDDLQLMVELELPGSEPYASNGVGAVTVDPAEAPTEETSSSSQ